MQAAAAMPAVGQTRAGRLGEAPPPGATGAPGAATAAAAPNPRQYIEEVVRGSRAAIFSKTICPSSRKAKEILSSFLPPGQFTVVELDQRPDGGALQDALEAQTGKRTVPHVFVGAGFVGGADDLEALQARGQLAARLGGT